jgi:hypothetical protein
MKIKHYLPIHKRGNKCDNFARVVCETEVEAAMLYRKAKRKLKSIHRWEEFSAQAKFHLTDRFGHTVSRAPEVGDCIRIAMPGLKNTLGGGGDWVKIRLLQEKEEGDSIQMLILRLHPCKPPGGKKPKVAHFLQENASNTFLLMRDGKMVLASVHGRNEQVNLQVGLWNSLRNLVVAYTGFMGINSVQWQKFVDEIVAQ